MSIDRYIAVAHAFKAHQVITNNEFCVYCTFDLRKDDWNFQKLPLYFKILKLFCGRSKGSKRVGKLCGPHRPVV